MSKCNTSASHTIGSAGGRPSETISKLTNPCLEGEGVELCLLKETNRSGLGFLQETGRGFAPIHADSDPRRSAKIRVPSLEVVHPEGHGASPDAFSPCAGRLALLYIWIVGPVPGFPFLLSIAGKNVRRPAELLIFCIVNLVLVAALGFASKPVAGGDATSLQPPAVHTAAAGGEAGGVLISCNSALAPGLSRLDQPSLYGIVVPSNISVAFEARGPVPVRIFTSSAREFGFDRFRRGPPSALSI